MGLSETYHYCATWHFWLVHDIDSFGVIILGEGISNKGKHFLNKMSKMGPNNNYLL
jgi:hypothetical protein